jgi:hypothetical protein
MDRLPWGGDLIEMPPNGTFFSPLPPISQPRLRANGTFETEETVNKRTFLSDGYVGRAKEREELDRRYSKIGIPAVAAAVRYQGDTKIAEPRNDDRVEAESAA